MKALAQSRNTTHRPAAKPSRVTYLPRRTGAAERTKKSPYTFFNVMLFVLICFVVVAAMQTIQINRLMADTRALSTDIAEVQVQQSAVREKAAERLASIQI